MAGETEELVFEMVLRKTAAAALLDLGDGEQHWFPFSQVPELEEEIDVGDDGVVDVPIWLLKDKGLY
jgi:hypothetical protein